MSTTINTRMIRNKRRAVSGKSPTPGGGSGIAAKRCCCKTRGKRFQAKGRHEAQEDADGGEDYDKTEVSKEPTIFTREGGIGK